MEIKIPLKHERCRFFFHTKPSIEFNSCSSKSLNPVGASIEVLNVTRPVYRLTISHLPFLISSNWFFSFSDQKIIANFLFHKPFFPSNNYRKGFLKIHHGFSSILHSLLPLFPPVLPQFLHPVFRITQHVSLLY